MFRGIQSGCADERTAPQPGIHKPREIVIRCAGPSKPWIIWLEIVFIEWSKSSFSVYTRTGEAVLGGGVSLGLLPRTAGPLSWREVLKFVQSHDLAAISGSDPEPINIYGVRRWQGEVIAAAMKRLSTIVPLLARLSEKELQSLHERLGGFLSENSIHLLTRLAAVTGGPLARKSLTGIAQLVGGAPDPMDAASLTEACGAYLADQNAEKVLARYRDVPAPPPKLFQFDYRRRLRCLRIRAGLFEWLRAKPKPNGGLLYCGNMDDELPVLHGLLRERAAEVFQGLAGTHRQAIEEFVSWFLDKAHPYAKYFTGRYNYTSSTVYTYGRPRFAAWAQLGKEVQDAAKAWESRFPKAYGSRRCRILSNLRGRTW
jgi:hypothetical protein